MLLSVIVPIYNEGKYLERCIKSLLQLNISKYEILLVDDGSSDKSVDICDAYELRYDFIHAFHKENGGVTSARKYGVEKAKGKYIAFVDGDDWVGEKIFTDFISQMEKDDTLDICIGGLRKIFPDGLEYTICQPSSNQFMTNIHAMKEMLQWKKFRWEFHGNIYRKELFVDFNPPNDIRIGEDLVSNFILLRHARKVFYAPIYQYYYFTNSESVTESGKRKMKTIMKSFYFVSRIGIKNKKLNILIGELYTKEIIKDIFSSMVFENKFIGHIPIYRTELKNLVEIKEVHLFMSRHFNMVVFQQALENDNNFFEFWDMVLKEIVKKLHNQTLLYKNIYIYGEGVISNFVVELLKKYNIQYNAFVVSDGQKKRNKDVKYLSEINDENSQTCFILALASTYYKEIIYNLHNKGYKNFLTVDVISYMYR